MSASNASRGSDTLLGAGAVRVVRVIIRASRHEKPQRLSDTEVVLGCFGSVIAVVGLERVEPRGDEAGDPLVAREEKGMSERGDAPRVMDPSEDLFGWGAVTRATSSTGVQRPSDAVVWV